MDKLYIIISAYNERENISEVIEEWHDIICRLNTLESSTEQGESRLVIIDDGSTDDTYKIMKKEAESHPFLLPIHKANSGHGASILYGYKYALDKADYIFQTDADGQTLPEEFWEFWNLRNTYDMIIGHRNKRQDGLSRFFVSKVLKLVIRCCFHVTVLDANTPFRLMKTEDLRSILQDVPDDYNLTNVAIAVIYTKRGMKVKYVPITFQARRGGENSINIRKIIKIGKQAIGDFKAINEHLKKGENLR